MASPRRLSCCKRAFFTSLLQPPFLILLRLSFSPLPVQDATRSLRLHAPPCTPATGFVAAAAAVAAEGKQHTRTGLYSHAIHSLFFKPLFLRAARLPPGVASRDSFADFCASDVQCCTCVGFTAPSYFPLLSSPPASQTSSLDCLSLRVSSKSQHHARRAAVRGSHLPQAGVLRTSRVHSSASRVSFISARTSRPAAASSLFSFAESPNSTASLIFPPAASAAVPAPAVFPSTARASASAAGSTAGRAALAASAACSAAATTSCAPCSSGWNTYPAWLQGVWQVRFRCLLGEYAEEETSETKDAEDVEQHGQRRTLPLLTSFSARGENMTPPSCSCAPRLTQGGDGTETQSVSISSMNGDKKSGDFASLNLLSDASSVALNPCDDLPVLLRAFCSIKRCSSSRSSSSVETPISSVNGLGPSHSARACRSSTDSHLSRSSSGHNPDSGSRPVAIKRGVSISGYADTPGRSAGTRGPSSRSSSTTVSLHTSSTELLKYGDDSRGETAFHQSSSSTPDSAAPRDWRDFFSKGTRSIPCCASQPRHVSGALHLLTPLQRRSLVLLQETIRLYDVCLEPGGILRFELPAAHLGRRSAAETNAAAAATAPSERNIRTSYAGNATGAESAEKAHLNAQKKTVLHSRQPQVPLKKQQQQLEMWQQQKKQQQQQTHREVHIHVAGKQPLQQTLHNQQQPQASRRPEHGCEELQYFLQLLEEQEQHFEQQKSESSGLSQEQQHQHAQQPKRCAPHHTCQPTPKAQQRSHPGQAFVRQLQQLEKPNTRNQETPSCKARVRGYSAGDEQQGPATPLLLQHPLLRHVKYCAQDKLQRRQQSIVECVPLTWYFTPASRRLALLFWLPACKLMLRLSCEVRRSGPAGCIYEKGPLYLPAGPLLVYLRDGLDSTPLRGFTRADAACGAVAAASAAACLKEIAAAGTQASPVEDSGEITGNCAAASGVFCPVDRWAEWLQLCRTPVQEPTAGIAAMGSGSRSSHAAGKINHWRRIPSGVWGDGFLYSCTFEGAECCGGMQRMRSLHRDRQWKQQNERRGHLQWQQHEQQKRSSQQEIQSLARRSQREESLRETEEPEDAQQPIQQQGHTQRQPVSQREGLLWQRTQSSDLLPGGEHQMRPKSSLLLEQPHVCTAHMHVKKSDGMALLAAVYLHLKRPRLSRASTQPISPALRPQQGFLTLRTGQQRHAFLQELRALQQVQLQYLRQFFFRRAVQRDQRVGVQQRHEQEQHQPQQKQLQPRQLQDEQKRRWEPQLHAEEQRVLQIQLLDEQRQQRQQQEEYVSQQREGQQHQANTLQQEAEHAEQQDQKKVLQQQEWQQPERGNHKKQYSPVHRRQQQLLWTGGERGLLHELFPDVTKGLYRSVKLLFVERERRWYAAGGLLQRQRRRRTVKEKSAEVSRKSSFGSWATRKEGAPERRISVISVALNGKVVGWTLPPPPFPVAVGDLLQHLTHAVRAKSATGADLPALLSCEEDTAGQEKAEKGKGAAGAEDCAAADEEEQAVPPPERGRGEATEETKRAAVAADAILDDYALLAGVQGEEEAVAAGEGKAGAAQTKRHTAAASAVLYKQFDGSSKNVDTGRGATTPSAALANGAQTRRKAARGVKLDEADPVVSQLRAAATPAHERDTGGVEGGQRPKAKFTGETESSTQKAACEEKQVDAAVCRGTTHAEALSRQKHYSATAGEKRTNGAACGSKSATVAAVPTAQRAALGKQKATIYDARIKHNVQQDVAAALLHPAVQRKLGSHSFCVKHVVYLHRTRLVNFVLQEPLL